MPAWLHSGSYQITVPGVTAICALIVSAGGASLVLWRLALWLRARWEAFNKKVQQLKHNLWLEYCEITKRAVEEGAESRFSRIEGTVQAELKSVKQELKKHVEEQIASVRSELRPNHGESFKDLLDGRLDTVDDRLSALESTTDNQDKSLRSMRSLLKNGSDRFDRLEKGQARIRKDFEECQGTGLRSEAFEKAYLMDKLPPESLDGAEEPPINSASGLTISEEKGLSQ